MQKLIESGGLQSVSNIAEQQVIYLDFDGEMTHYDGEILSVDNVIVKNSGITPERIVDIVAELNAKYAAQNVRFVTERPINSEYSTIYVGRTDACSTYGDFAGVTETLDRNNQNKNDNAFVLLDSTASNEQIISTVSHEADHLLGTLLHGGNGLFSYAEELQTASSLSNVNVGENEVTGIHFVSAGAILADTSIQSGGKMLLYDYSGSEIGKISARNGSDGEGGTIEKLQFNGNSICLTGELRNLTIESPLSVSVFNKSDLSAGLFVLNNLELQADAELMRISGTDIVLDSYRSMSLRDGSYLKNITVKEYGQLELSRYTGFENGEFYTGATISGDTTVIRAGFGEPAKIGNLTYDSAVFRLSGETANLNVASGGILMGQGSFRNITLQNNASASIGSAVLDGIQLGGSGYNDLRVMDSAFVSNVTVREGGFVRADALSAFISGATLYNAGSMSIYRGGVNDITVHSGGHLAMERYGLVQDLELHQGGYFHADGMDISVLNGFVGSVGVFGFDSSNTASSFLMGSAENLIFSNGALIVAGSGALYDSLLLNNSARFMSGATGSGLTVSGRELDVSSGATVSDVELKDGAILRLSGSADGVLLDSSTRLELWYGQVQNLTVHSGASVEIHSGTVREISVLSGGKLSGSYDGSISDLQVYSGANVTLWMSGTMQNVTLHDGGVISYSYYENYSNYTAGISASGQGRIGELVIHSSAINLYGTTENVILDGGLAVVVKQDAELSHAYLNGNITFHSGAEGNDLILGSSARLTLNSNGTLDTVTVSAGGRVHIAHANASNMELSGGSVYAGYSAHVSDTEIHSGGTMEVYNGTAVNTVLHSGGILSLTSGAVHSGSLTLESGAQIQVDAASYIDFTLAGWQNKNAYLINDLSLISGGVKYTITVDSDQRSGQWKLAGNAADFTNTLTVRDTYGNIYGTITVNKESFEYDSRSYTLTVSNGDLILTISEPSDPRVNIYSSGVLVSSGTYISGIVLSSYLDSAAVSSMGVLESATVSSGAYVQILSGGSIVDATVTDGGRLYVSGKAENLQVLSRGDVRVFSGLALDTEVFAGGSFGVEYGSAVDTVIYSGAAVWLTPYGEYQNTLLHSGGRLQYNGSVVTVLNGESGTIGGVTIDSGSY